MADYCKTVREHGYYLISLFIFDFIFQLVQALFLNLLVLVGVMMRTTMLVVALMGVTVVDLMSRLLIAQTVNAWEKILLAKLYLELFVHAHWKVY